MEEGERNGQDEATETDKMTKGIKGRGGGVPSLGGEFGGGGKERR